MVLFAEDVPGWAIVFTLGIPALIALGAAVQQWLDKRAARRVAEAELNKSERRDTIDEYQELDRRKTLMIDGLQRTMEAQQEAHSECEESLRDRYANEVILHAVCVQQNRALRALGAENIDIPELLPMRPMKAKEKADSMVRQAQQTVEIMKRDSDVKKKEAGANENPPAGR